VNEETAHGRLAAPEVVGEAFAAMLLPGFEVDVAVVGQGSDEVITCRIDPSGNSFERAAFSVTLRSAA
jgi:hypothetical protein